MLSQPGMEAHTLNPRTEEAETEGSDFETSLVYRVSSRTDRTTQTGPVSKNQKQNKTEKPKTNKQNKTKKE